MSSFKYEELINNIRENIEIGIWSAGEKILSERDLVTQFGVSRITVKKALDELIQDGTLVRHQGRRGTFVSDSESKLSNTRANLIGVAIDDVSDRFGSSLLRGIEDCLWDRKIHTLICNGDRNFDKVESYFHSLLERDIDGVIFSPVIDEEAGYEKNIQIIEMLKKKRMPFVFIDRYIPGIEADIVITDHRSSTELLTSTLINKGHKRILLVSGLPCSSIEEREKGFKDAMDKHGIPVEKQDIVRLNDNHLFKDIRREDKDQIKEKLSHYKDYTAIIALNNRLLNGVVSTLPELDPLWKDRMTLALHDEISIGLPYKDEIIQIVQPDYELGKEAARLLIQKIENPGDPYRKIILQSCLMNGV